MVSFLEINKPKKNYLVKEIQSILDSAYTKYHSTAFITLDPISIPHRFTKLQDIEIAAFWISILAWGNRKSILKSGHELMQRMDNAPYDFITHHTESDRARFESFVHRTFNGEDALYFLEFFQQYYKQFNSLEFAFSNGISKTDATIANGIIHFKQQFIMLTNAPARTLKHISSPEKKSRCKRICMFLRWMVRQDDLSIDFGLWKRIRTDQLIIPLDVHVERTARQLGLLQRKQLDWQAAVEITEACKKFDPMDPVRYDYALFGLSQGR